MQDLKCKEIIYVDSPVATGLILNEAAGRPVLIQHYLNAYVAELSSIKFCLPVPLNSTQLRLSKSRHLIPLSLKVEASFGGMSYLMRTLWL